MPQLRTRSSTFDAQRPLFPEDAEPFAESPDYLTRQLLTYLGNKRTLLGPIGAAVEQVKQRLGKTKLRSFDPFSGSGVVSRFFKAHSSLVVSNDLEEYAAVTGRCFLRNGSTVDWRELTQLIFELNAVVAQVDYSPGFIEELYAPRDEAQITPEDRVFYTRENARRLDNYRRLVDAYVPDDWRDLVLGPLLSKASIHANTAGVFKGFYKNGATKVGQYGGRGADALSRIRGQIELELPVLSRFECESRVLCGDALEAARQSPGMDLAYLDPPYNQHPYGSNYFMLNLLVNYQRPAELSRVSGIPTDWRRSGYNVRAQSAALLRSLIAEIDAPFLLVSFSNEGFIAPAEMRSLLAEFGALTVFEIPHNAFRGSRNFNNRPIHVTEQLFLVERG